MTEYRAYVVGLDGHFLSCDCFECSTDDRAIERAGHLVNRHAIEVWSGNRIVAKLGRHGLAARIPQQPTSA